MFGFLKKGGDGKKAPALAAVVKTPEFKKAQSQLRLAAMASGRTRGEGGAEGGRVAASQLDDALASSLERFMREQVVFLDTLTLTLALTLALTLTPSRWSSSTLTSNACATWAGPTCARAPAARRR